MMKGHEDGGKCSQDMEEALPIGEPTGAFCRVP